ncbi:MAG: DUF2798 domain-containing protein [Chitinophagaceae bacterium]
MKKKITFALLMGIITTGIISFTLISVNVGLRPDFGFIWMRSWVLSYCIATPCILLFGPMIQRVVDKMFRKQTA